MTKEEKELLFELIKKANLLLPRSQYISIERMPDNTLKLFGVNVANYGSPEYIEEE